MTKTNKQIGYEWESIAEQYYINNWYDILKKNFTFPWWEIDIIAKKDNIIHFIEVKVVNFVDDLSNYISMKKLLFLDRSIQNYLYKNNVSSKHVLDVVFIKDKKIFHVVSNVTWW